MSDNLQGDYGAAVGNFEGMPKASIGNYKGVMLCNRPNEFGQQRRQEPTGPRPFNSRVDPKTANPTGWNPCQHIFPKSGKKRNVFGGILKRHRQFISNLQHQKRCERDDMEMQTLYEEQKVNRFKEQAQKQRHKIKDMKQTGPFLEDENEMQFEDQAPQQEALADYEQEAPSERPVQQDAASKKSGASRGSKKSKGSQKPAWATTEKQQEENKEEEIDGLIEFAYDLDYEKYMEDFEVRQAFEIIKDRIVEIKADQDWKVKIADEWNKTAEMEAAAAQAPKDAGEQQDARSVYSYRSGTLSRKSKANSQASSYKHRVAKAKANADAQNDWDRSTVASERGRDLTVEDKVAAKIANEVLRDNQKLRGVHSNQSIKKILEKEAKRQLLLETNGGVYNPPVMSKINERGEVNKADPSNLPYLHKCPAV